MAPDQNAASTTLLIAVPGAAALASSRQLQLAAGAFYSSALYSSYGQIVKLRRHW
jgi:hypothetical protein